MANSKALVWDQIGEREYETGVSNGVLYPYDSSAKDYGVGVAWNGLTAVNESPEGAEATDLYADDIKYLSLISAENFKGTIEAYTYPKEFAECDGSAAIMPGVYVGQQTRKSFGFCYRTSVGNDMVGTDYGYKLHLVYGCKASPSAKAYGTINDSPDATTFSWELNTTPVPAFTVNGVQYKPTATITIDTTKLDASVKSNLAKLEEYLYGSTTNDPKLPTPAQVYTLLTKGSLTAA